MRTPPTPNFLESGNGGGSLLAPFAQGRLGSNLADARERAAPLPATVGHPQNQQVAVYGARGKFWAHRKDPHNGPTVLVFYTDTDLSGKPSVDLKYGMTVFLRANNDTNPVHWVLEGRPSDMLQPVTGFDPCTGIPTGIAAPPTVPYGLNTKTSNFDPSFWPNGQNPSNTNNPLGNISPPLPQGYTSFNLVASDKYKATPYYGPNPYSPASVGDLWTNSKDGVTRRFTQNNIWEPVTQDYRTGKLKTNCKKGDVLYYTATPPSQVNQASSELDLADSSNLACVGRIAGVAIADYSAGQLATVQAVGLFELFGVSGNSNATLLGSTTNGTSIYLGANGHWTTTAPAAGNQAGLVRIGKVLKQSRSIQLMFDPQIKRGQTPASPGGTSPRDPADPGGGVYTGGGIDLRQLPTTKPPNQGASGGAFGGIFYFA